VRRELPKVPVGGVFVGVQKLVSSGVDVSSGVEQPDVVTGVG
jgi:hypothetical protein